jgi:hypothetical protein
LRANLEIGVGVITDAVVPFEKTNRRIKVRADLPVIRLKIQPVGSVNETGAQIRLPA